jgi:hypothetical protein
LIDVSTASTRVPRQTPRTEEHPIRRNRVLKHEKRGRHEKREKEKADRAS